MPEISELYIYPVKSLGGIALSSATLSDRGFQYDRRWMLIDESNRCITQRDIPQMALLDVALKDDMIQVKHRVSADQVTFPMRPDTIEKAFVSIWDDTCEIQFVSATIDKWFSSVLSVACRLVYMPDASRRAMPGIFSGEITSLSDACPVLILGQSSLDDLNGRLNNPVPVNRFRPNIVFTGSAAYEEDTFDHIAVNNNDFYGVKRCGRCLITTIDQQNASISREPLKTLASYRTTNNKTYFGKYLFCKGTGDVSIGDNIVVY